MVCKYIIIKVGDACVWVLGTMLGIMVLIIIRIMQKYYSFVRARNKILFKRSIIRYKIKEKFNI